MSSALSNQLFVRDKAGYDEFSRQVKKTLTLQVKKGIRPPPLLPQGIRVWRWVGQKAILVMV